MLKEEGENIWLFPDGKLPNPSDVSKKLVPHEALIILNTSEMDTNIKITFYFEDKEPIKNISTVVKSNRVKCIRMDHPDEIGGIRIPYNKQYALKIESDIKVVATFGRLDTSSKKNSFLYK